MISCDLSGYLIQIIIFTNVVIVFLRKRSEDNLFARGGLPRAPACRFSRAARLIVTSKRLESPDREKLAHLRIKKLLGREYRNIATNTVCPGNFSNFVFFAFQSYLTYAGPHPRRVSPQTFFSSQSSFKVTQRLLHRRQLEIPLGEKVRRGPCFIKLQACGTYRSRAKNGVSRFLFSVYIFRYIFRTFQLKHI